MDADNENMKKNYTPEYKAKTVLEVLREEKTINQISAERGIHPNILGRWKKEVMDGLPSLFEGEKKARKEKREQEEQIQELYAQIGELTTKVNWLKKKSGIDV